MGRNHVSFTLRQAKLGHPAKPSQALEDGGPNRGWLYGSNRHTNQHRKIGGSDELHATDGKNSRSRGRSRCSESAEAPVRDEGYTVEVQSNGKSALESFQAAPPAVIILDLRLPKLSGSDVCKEIKAQAPTLPIVVLSATSDVSDKVLLLELGADDYVTKPFSPASCWPACAQLCGTPPGQHRQSGQFRRHLD
jgi:CheY-like chemotaxis protein